MSVQTLYLAWGSKRELLRGYMEHALAGERDSPEDAAELFAGLQPDSVAARLADLVTEIAHRAALGWHLYRDASAIDPEIAADWNELQLLRHRLLTRILSGIPASALRLGSTPAAAVDTAWVITSPESYDLLVRRLGYDTGQFRDWMADVLGAAVLAPSRSDS